LEDLEHQNQALEDLKKLAAGGDKELASMAQYQMGVIYSRTGKPDEAAKIFRELAEKHSVFVPRPVRCWNWPMSFGKIIRKKPRTVYQQVKKDSGYRHFRAGDRGLELLAPNLSS